MQQVVWLIVIIAVGIVAIKVALALLLVAGLIFRPKETIGLIAILATYAGFRAHPGIGFGILGLIAVIALYRLATKPKDTGQEPAGSDD